MEYYNLDRLVDLIKEKDFKVISIQCSDTNESIRLCDYLQNLFSKESERNFYILGDVLTGSCCLDIIATKRLNAVYIGESCFFELESRYFVFHLYPKLNVDLSLLKEKVNYLCNSLEFHTVLYIYKCTLHHVLEEVISVFLKNRKSVLVASCPDYETMPEQDSDLVKFSNRSVYQYYLDEGRIAKKCVKRDLENLDLVFYLNDNDVETLSKSISLESRCDEFYEMRILDGSYSIMDRSNWSQEVLMKRYLAVEKAKQTQTFGIITLTKSFKNGNKLRRLLQELLIKEKRKCNLFCINHLTEAKLQNFHRVETWVLLSCNLTHLSLEKELERLVVFPYELLVALGVLDWSKDTYVFDFQRLSDVIEEYIKVNYPENGEEIDVEDNENEKESLEKYKHEQLRTITKMELSRRFEDLYETISSNEKREFKGVDPDYNFDKTPRILKGSHGTPTTYKHELEYK